MVSACSAKLPDGTGGFSVKKEKGLTAIYIEPVE